eukprot:TRINITY_DN108349_c0_g1_i1.p1 TRINITY_DN108349_c0_g1~~TRINITY_DN108349_c0_g1_i1.p1  ORF type:complete len:206 (-),score=12.69 TRINITY_DN108349_c0_g1_i1:415-984(-)
MVQELRKHSLTELLQDPPPGPPMSIIEGASLVAGGFIAGAIAAPDLTRYCRTQSGVVWQSLVAIVFGDYITGLSSVLLAHAVKSSNVSDIVISSVGWVGIIIVLLGAFKINDWNLYSSGLATVNILDTLLGIKGGEPCACHIDTRLVRQRSGCHGYLEQAARLLNSSECSIPTHCWHRDCGVLACAYLA